MKSSRHRTDSLKKIKRKSESVGSKPLACMNPDCNDIVELIFMDLNMPNMDGFQAAEKILAAQKEYKKEHPHQPDCSIVALTAYKDKASKDRCFSIGMKEVINKPADWNLINKII